MTRTSGIRVEGLRTLLTPMYCTADVAYLLQSGSVLSFGEVDNKFIVEYEEAQASYAALEMVVRGMAAQASKEVREQLDL